MGPSGMVVDTSIFIEYLRSKKKDQTIFQKLPDKAVIFISSVTLFELLIGASSNEKWEELRKLTEDIPVLGFTEKIASLSAQIYHELKKSNKLIEYRDIFIAATAIANDLPILTLNKKDFKRIKNLTLIEL